MLGTLKALMAATALAAVGGAAIAQDDYPSKPIHIVVPYPPGGLADTLTRTLGEKLTEAWGQQVVVENKPGAGGIVGAQTVAEAEPDGYTLLLGNTNIAINPSVYQSLPYETSEVLTGVVYCLAVPNLIVVHQDVPANTLQELIDLAKSKPGELNFASASLGSFPHLVIELLMQAADIQMTHVPYAGAAPAMAAILGHETDVLASDLPGAMSHVEQGTLKALAISSSIRSPIMPDVPTAEEAGLEGFAAVGWQGIMAPVGTPDVVIEKLNGQINEILASQEFQDMFVNRGVIIVGGTPEEFNEFIAEDTKRWAGAVEAAGGVSE